MVNIEEDTATTGKRNKFEAAVTCLLLKDPVAKHWNNSNKHNQDQISDTYSQGQGFGSKAGFVKTGVHFRYHTTH